MIVKNAVILNIIHNIFNLSDTEDVILKRHNSETIVYSEPEYNCQYLYHWMVDNCLTSNEQYFSYIRDENVQWYIKTIWNNFSLPQEKYGDLDRDEQFSLL